MEPLLCLLWSRNSVQVVPLSRQPGHDGLHPGRKKLERKENPASSYSGRLNKRKYFHQSGGERRETRACTVVACSEEAPGQAETHLTSEDIEKVRKLQRNQQKYKIAPPGQKYDEETFLQDRREFGRQRQSPSNISRAEPNGVINLMS